MFHSFTDFFYIRNLYKVILGIRLSRTVLRMKELALMFFKTLLNLNGLQHVFLLM